MKIVSNPHDAFESILVQQFPLLRCFLDPEYEPGAGDPVGVELVGGHRLEQLFLVLRHETRVDDVVESGESLLDCRRDGPFETRLRAELFQRQE